MPAEALLYSPHGINPNDASLILAANPPVQTLALMTGLNNVSTPWNQFNLGLPNSVQCFRALRAKYWIRTHDEATDSKGLMTWLLKRKEYTEEDMRRDMEKNGDDASLVNFLEVGNGETLDLA